MKLGQLYRTVRHLRPSQVGWRVVNVGRLQLNKIRPAKVAWRVGGAVFAVHRPSGLVPTFDVRCRAAAELWAEGEVEHLALHRPREDWAGAGLPKLWRYERQYHSELVALAVASAAQGSDEWLQRARELLRSWMVASPPARGDAWEAYPVARRILNWCLAGYVAPALAADVAPGIAAQVRFLSSHLEYHLLGNHLICDAAALMTGGAAVKAEDMDRLHGLGAKILARELERQVLGDGGYGERTAQYHAIVLRDVLIAIAFSRARGLVIDARIEAAARSMANWLTLVARGDSIPFLNDAAPGATPSVAEVLSLARALDLLEGPWDSWLGRVFGRAAGSASASAQGDVELPDTGWSIIRDGGHELLFEHGPIGPDEQPGHGHSDALSFELFWDGHPIVVDTSDTTYDIGPIRDFERSAAAHASVTVGGEGPDELWAAFRVGARGRVSGGRQRSDDPRIRFLQGAVRAPAGWTHFRRIIFWPGEALVVLDRVEGSRAAVRSHLPLAPGCRFESPDILRFGGGQLRLQLMQGVFEPTREGWVGEGFGRRKARTTVTFSADAAGKIAYAILAPGRTVSISERSCEIEGPSGSASVPLPRVS